MTNGVHQPSGIDSDHGETRSFSLAELQAMQAELQRFVLEYEFALREVQTKLTILQDEFEHLHDYNPIEHVSSRVKSTDSVMGKVARRGIVPELDTVRSTILDIAGVRVTCCFVRDAYRLLELLGEQEGLTIRRVKDYIATPKANGYRSLHVVVDVFVHLSTGVISIPVEVQFRTIAMDFWASLEHRIYYKYDGQVPPRMVEELKEAADTATALDARMERLHSQLHGAPDARGQPKTRS